MHFAPVGRVSLAPRRQDARVHLGPETEAPPSVAAIEADAAKALVLRELSNRELEGLRLFVEFHGNDRKARRGKKKGIRPIIIFRC
jgi:hypothetical protein